MAEKLTEKDWFLISIFNHFLFLFDSLSWFIFVICQPLSKRSNLLLESETIGMKAEELERPAVVEEVDHAHDPAGVDHRLDQDHAHGLVDEHHLSLDLGHASGQEVHLRSV